MAIKKSTKKASQQPSGAEASTSAKKAKRKDAKAASAKQAKAAAKDGKGSKAKAAKGKAKGAKNGKPGLFARLKQYISSVRTEMKRVTWPSKKELINYSVAVVASLIVVGIVIAAFDLVISEGLALFSGLRG